MTTKMQPQNFENRTARAVLEPSRKPYWCVLERWCHMGYHRARGSGRWVTRFVPAKGPSMDLTIGEADDQAAADGVKILSFEQARAASRNWCIEQAIEAASQPLDDSPFNKVGAACSRE
ncbi:MAG: hypothetical protein HOH65_20020 [Rhodospirillaceae bacterium]|jgi:hypothetical protein|nr:hypothetical protein [Rhodospirillaceae bacterium]